MPLQTSGQISLADIATEFGGTTPHSMSEYYSAATGIPASGTLEMSDFYGASAAAAGFTLTSNQQDFDARAFLIAQGWNGSDAVTLTIDTGVYVYASSTSAYAFDMGGSYPNGLTLINNGFIMGRGGNAAPTPTIPRGSLANLLLNSSMFQNGQAGGPAIKMTGNLTIQNSAGYIGAGGGGAGAMRGGAGAGGGSTPSYNSGAVANTTINNTTTYTVASSGVAPLGQKGAQPTGGYGRNSYYNQGNATYGRLAHSPAGGNGGGGTEVDIIV